MRVKILRDVKNEYPDLAQYEGRTGEVKKQFIGRVSVLLDGCENEITFPKRLVEVLADAGSVLKPSPSVITHEMFKSCIALNNILCGRNIDKMPLLSSAEGHIPYPLIADLCADFEYEKHPYDLDTCLDVLVVESLGYGDLLFGLRTVQALKTYFPSVEVRLISNVEGAKKIADLGGDKEYSVQVYSSVAYAKKIETGLMRPSLVVMGPVVDAVAVKELEDVTKAVPNVSVLKINEYGFCKSKWRQTTHSALRAFSGICQPEMGIFIEPSLLPQNQQGDLKYLGELQDESLRYVLKETCCDKLYFCYLKKSESITKFVKCILLLETVPPSWPGANVDIVIAKSAHCELELQLLKNDFDEFDDVLQVERDSQIFFKIKKEAELHAPLNAQHITVEAQRKRRLRFILWSIKHADVLTLFKTCEPFVCVTGDQSATEALSAGKLMAYECIEHKIDFFKSLCCAWEARFPEDKGLETLANTLDRAGIVRLVRDEELKKRCVQFAQFLSACRNLTIQIGLRVKRCLMRDLSAEILKADDEYVAALLNPGADLTTAKSNLESAINRRVNRLVSSSNGPITHLPIASTIIGTPPLSEAKLNQ